jgi:predicted O-linked N-acetylglucosamine transferase (SPINDLY family)
LSEALASYDRALLARPDYAEALANRGATLHALRRHGEALTDYDRVLALEPGLIEAWIGRGDVLFELTRYSDAFAAYDKASAINADAPYLEGRRLCAKVMTCDWADREAEVSHFLSAIRSGVPTHPFHLLHIATSAADQLMCAKQFVADQPLPSYAPLWRGEIYSHDRIRVAYLSSDLREHAVGHLTVGLFEQHERSRFKVIAISFGPEKDSNIRRRIKNSIEHFVDARSYTDRQIADLVRQREIDIAVDLNGFTQSSRTNVFACRAAPIQVSYLGYPATMGADYIDYIIADRFVIPEDQQQHYQEKVIYMPDCFQVNSSTRSLFEKVPTRAEAGLPERGFVFCSFCNNYKISPRIFDVWMRLLRQVEGSVLWVLTYSAAAESNLRREAASRGVEPDRLIFARSIGFTAYLTRYRLADLFLDTFPFNGGTTASDALWAGLPVVTCSGETFVGRMAGSLLNTVGVSQLVTHSLADYEQLALTLARDFDLISSIKAKLARDRDACPLFDTARFTRHLEAAYQTMWETWQRGEPARSFDVQRLM